MISRVLTQMATTQILWMTCLGLLIFMGFFFGMLIWTHRKESNALYKSLSHLPLEEAKYEK